MAGARENTFRLHKRLNGVEEEKSTRIFHDNHRQFKTFHNFFPFSLGNFLLRREEKGRDYDNLQLPESMEVAGEIFLITDYYAALSRQVLVG